MTAPLLVLSVLFSGCAFGDRANPDHMPEFSWDRVPQYMHIRKSTAFTEEEIQYLATFPLITFEKTTGLDTYGSTEEGTLAAARAVKAINPKARILFYRNVLVHYAVYDLDKQLQEIESPFLQDKWNRGNLVKEWLEAYDLSNPEVRDWWARTAALACADDAIDGLFLDGLIKVLSNYKKVQLPPGKKEAVIDGYREMMKQTRAALPPGKLMVANIIRALLPDSGLSEISKFDGSYIEGFTLPWGDVNKADFIARGIEAVQTAAREGKIIAMTLGLGESAADEDKIDDSRKRLDSLEGLQKSIDFNLALFLVCAEKYSYLMLHDGYVADIRNGVCMSKVWLKRLPEYDRPLGPPKGPAKRDGYVFTREFEHVSVRVDVETETGEIVWHAEDAGTTENADH